MIGLKNNKRHNKFALILSCGVTLGAAHLGILKSLFKQG
jgi:predicted acylesterase/phospholipase RssA